MKSSMKPVGGHRQQGGNRLRLFGSLVIIILTALNIIKSNVNIKQEEQNIHIKVKPASTEPLQVGLEKEKTPLYLITPSSRPYLLLKSIFHVLPLHQCFDVHWIIVHTVQDQRVFKAPLFRDVFHWITELSTFNEESISGNHERNVGLSHVVERASHGLVYFLDDDNVLSMDLCQQDVQNELDIEKMYYADQIQCSSPRRKPLIIQVDGHVPTQLRLIVQIFHSSWQLIQVPGSHLCGCSNRSKKSHGICIGMRPMESISP